MFFLFHSESALSKGTRMSQPVFTLEYEGRKRRSFHRTFSK